MCTVLVLRYTVRQDLVMRHKVISKSTYARTQTRTRMPESGEITARLYYWNYWNLCNGVPVYATGSGNKLLIVAAELCGSGSPRWKASVFTWIAACLSAGPRPS
jgi:hypothetical protein